MKSLFDILDELAFSIKWDVSLKEEPKEPLRTLTSKQLLKLVKTKGKLVKVIEKDTPFADTIRRQYKKQLGTLSVKNLFGTVTHVYVVSEDYDGSIKYYDYPQSSKRKKQKYE